MTRTLATLLLLLSLPGLALAADLKSAAPEAVWFDDINSTLPLSDNMAGRLLSDIKQYLLNAQALSDLPVYADESPRIVFISVARKNQPARVVSGSGHGLKEAISHALRKLDTHGLSADKPVIRLDIVQQAIKIMASKNTRMDLYDQSLYGIAFDSSTSSYALLAEQITPEQVFTDNSRLNLHRLRQKNLIEKGTQGKSTLVTLYRFKTLAYLLKGNHAAPLYRGHPAVTTVEADKLLASASAAGDYLLGAIQPDGSFIYRYNPATDKVDEDYNILRHAGTVYAMLQLYAMQNKPAMLAGIESATAFLLKHVKNCPPPADRQTLCLVHDNKIKLGANALAILVLTRYAELVDKTANSDILNKLGQWILTTQDSDGGFSIHKQYDKSGVISTFVSEYYPGEATLALLSLYQHDGNRKWLNAATSAIDNIIEQQKKVERPPHDHWLLHSLAQLYKTSPDKKYLDHSRYIAEEIMRTQVINPKEADLKGCYNNRPESAPTATRSEALLAADELADYIGDGQYRKQLRNSIEAALRFQQQLQYDEASSMYFNKPGQVIHAFKKSLTSPEVRIDYAQHNISSFIQYYKMAEK